MEHYQKYLEEGYTEEQAFYLAEIKTTQQILEDLGKNNIYMPTLLINSLLSMIVLPHEKAKMKNHEKIFGLPFSTFEKQMGITPILFVPIKCCDNEKVSFTYKTTHTFINKLRNGIAHQNIAVSIVNDKDFNITIKNKFQCRHCDKCKNPVCKEKGAKLVKGGGVIDFEITVNVAQLTRLANYFANAYMNAIEKK